MRTALPVWRSMLFVPAGNERLLRSAVRRRPDAFQIDLEDAVPVAQKASARQLVPGMAAELQGNGADVLVRINRPFRLAIPDIEAAIGPDVDGLNLPKVPDASYVRFIDEVVTEVERERDLEVGRTVFIVMVETAEGLMNVEELAAASPRVVALTIGAEDLALELGMEPTPEALLVPNVRLLAAARAAGILPIGYLASVADFTDLGAFRHIVRRSQELGFEGGFCIHPNQIEILNEEFSPRQDALESASELVDAYEQGLRDGKGAVTFRNKMIDQPVAQRASALLAKERTIREKEGAKPKPVSGPAS